MKDNDRYKQNVTSLSEEYTAFSPATVNGKKVSSIILYQSPITSVIQTAVTVGRTPIPLLR